MSLRAPLSWFGCCLASVLVLAGCSSDGGPSGGLSLDLVLEGGPSINKVDWRITDPAAGDRLLKEGSIDTNAPGATVSVEAYGLPPGGPYVIHLSATSEDGGTICKGSTEFEIAVGVVTELHVMLRCKTEPDSGAVRVDTEINICAQLNMVVVSSLTTSVGSSINVSAMASDQNGDPIGYKWEATAPSFADPTAAETTYACQAEGIQFITINVSDAEHCMDSHTVAIECIGSGTGTGGAGGDGGVGGMGMGGTGGTACKPTCVGNALPVGASQASVPFTCRVSGIGLPFEVNFAAAPTAPIAAGANTYRVTAQTIITTQTVNLILALWDSSDIAAMTGTVTPIAGSTVITTASVVLDDVPCRVCYERDTAVTITLATTEETWNLDMGTEQVLELTDFTVGIEAAGLDLVLSNVGDPPACFWGAAPDNSPEVPADPPRLTFGTGEGGSGGSAGAGGEGGSGGSAGTGGVGGMPPSAVILYDRTDRFAMFPFPDDFWLAPDASTPTGYRVALSVPSGEPDVVLLYSALMNETSKLDGFSPIGGIVIKLSAAPDTASLPLTPQASLEPSATLRLFDVAPGSATLGQRVPFQLTPVSRMLEGQEIDHSLVLYPSIPLASKGRYAIVVTTDARTDDGRSFGPSPSMARVLGPEQPGEAPEITQARDLLSEGVLDVLADEQVVSPPIDATDIALVFRFSVRSTDDIPLTPLSMKEQILFGSPPSYTIESVSPGSGDVAAVVRGTWQAPNWRENGYFISRDEEGHPQITGSLSVPFVLALPQAAESGPVPVLLFQHGSPGGAEDIVFVPQLTMAEDGFAAIGFTDALNRELGQDLDSQNTVLFQTLVLQQRFPDFAMQTYGDQMAFLRIIEQLGSLDRVPLPDGDGVPDLDLEAPLIYLGISQGSSHGSASLSYLPEIKAAALAVGGVRQAEGYFNGGTFIDEFPPGLLALLPNVTPTDFWVGLSIFQMIFDHQDAEQHAAFLYRNRLEVAGTTRKASVLFQEGVGDMLIPSNVTRSLAWTFGPIPHLEPIWDPTPILERVTSPVMGNIDPETTAAFYQFVAAGVPGIPPTPGCENEPNGHFCAQDAPAAQLQRVLFLRSAVEQAVPTIVDPLPLSN